MDKNKGLPVAFCQSEIERIAGLASDCHAKLAMTVSENVDNYGCVNSKIAYICSYDWFFASLSY